MARALFCCLPCIILTVSCTGRHAHYLIDEKSDRAELQYLIDEVHNEDSAERRFIVNQQIISIYQSNQEPELLDLFLTTYVERFPEDQYNAYYLLLVAEHQRRIGALPFAAYYYERIVKNHPDLLLENGRSIHRICLANLIDLVEESEIRVGYYRELISRFGDSIEKGSTYYDLASTYEKLGEWDLAMQFYKEFLKHPEAVIKGVPDVHEGVRELVTYYDLPRKSWTYENLDDLIADMSWAIRTQRSQTLNALRSQVNFFARAWEEEQSETPLELIGNIGAYLKNRIIVSPEVDRDSNDQEAYLRTTGWGFRIPTWYLYFRKIHFPADPEIHGQWEWAGIYLGEKPY